MGENLDLSNGEVGGARRRTLSSAAPQGRHRRRQRRRQLRQLSQQLSFTEQDDLIPPIGLLGQQRSFVVKDGEEGATHRDALLKGKQLPRFEIYE